MPTFADTRMFIAKGTTVPFNLNAIREGSSASLPLGKSASDGETLSCRPKCYGPLPSSIWQPTADFADYSDIGADGLYLRTAVTFDTETVLGKIVDFLDVMVSKENGDIVYDIETYMPIFNEPTGNTLTDKTQPLNQDLGAVLEGSYISITTAGQCLGSTEQQWEGQEPVAYFLDGALLPYGTEAENPGAVPCYPDSFLSTFKERVIRWTGFKKGGAYRAEADLTGVRIAMPTEFLAGQPDDATAGQKFVNGVASPDYKFFSKFKTLGNDINAKLVYTKGAVGSGEGQKVQMGIEYTTEINNVFGLPMTLNTVSFSFLWRWKNTKNIALNGPSMQMGASCTVPMYKSDGTLDSFTMNYNMQTFIPKSPNLAMEGERALANYAQRFQMTGASALEVVTFAREAAKGSDAEEQPIDDQVKAAMEAVTVGNLVICDAPHTKVEFADGTSCNAGTGGALDITIFDLDASMNFQLTYKANTGPVRKITKASIQIAATGVMALKQRVISAIISRITFGNEFFQNILEKAGELLGSFGITALDVSYDNEKLLGVWAAPAIAFLMNYQLSGTKDLNFDIVGPFNGVSDVISMAGQTVLAHAIGFFSMPPYNDGHVCAVNKHCKSSNCYLGMCQSCSYHITKLACQTTQINGQPLGCQWEANENNCDTWAGSTSLTCQMSDGCYWQKDYQDCGMYNRAEAICKVNCNCQGSWSKIYYVNNKGKTKYYWGNVCSGCHGQVEIAGTGRCSGTWHGSTAAGTCKPKKCNSLPVCSAGQVCYDSCTDSTNPAWPSGHSPRATLASTEQRKRPFDATGFTNRTSDLAALSASELYEHRNTSAANVPLDDDADLVDVFDIVHVVMHEIIQGEYPQAHGPW